MWDFPIFPERASTIAGEVDTIYFVLTGMSTVIAFGVIAAIIYFAVKYRSGAQVDRSNPVNGSIAIETTWIVMPLLLSIGMFTWAAVSYFDIKSPPPGEPIEIYVTGKQWMWKFQHPNGTREINTLHVPRGRLVKMTMTSQDVIHSFYVPAFRVKQDVLPGRYTSVWFKATKEGTYHLFCAEYCGTEHSYMGDQVHVMEPAEYEEWLRTGATGGANTVPGTGRVERAPSGETSEPYAAGPQERSLPETGDPARREAGARPPAIVEDGRALFEELRCSNCHRVDSAALYPAQGPVLQGVYGGEVELQNNRTIIADAEYLRESILYPQAKIVAGYPPVMPTFKGQISEEELMQLVMYLRSLGGAATPAENPDTTGAAEGE